MSLDLTPIKERLAKATPGPWRVWQNPHKKSDVAVETAWSHSDCEGDTELITDYLPTCGDAEFIAHSPEDIAALLAEVEKLRRAGSTLGTVIEKQCEAALDATGLHDLIDETGDGDWGTVWETVAEMGETCRRLRAQLDAVRALQEQAPKALLQSGVADTRTNIRGDLHRHQVVHLPRIQAKRKGGQQ